MYTVHCTLYTVHYTLYTVHCTLYTVQCTLCRRDNRITICSVCLWLTHWLCVCDWLTDRDITVYTVQLAYWLWFRLHFDTKFDVLQLILWSTQFNLTFITNTDLYTKLLYNYYILIYGYQDYRGFNRVICCEADMLGEIWWEIWWEMLWEILCVICCEIDVVREIVWENWCIKVLL